MTTYMERVAAGVCVNCKSPDVTHGRRCKRCRDYKNRYARDLAIQTRQAGCCITCGKSAMRGSSRCEGCRERNAQYAKEYREAAKCQN